MSRFLLNLRGICHSSLSYFWFVKLDTLPNLLIIFSYHLLFRAYMAKALCARSLDTWRTSLSLSLSLCQPTPSFFLVAPHRVPFRPPEPLITRVIMCVCLRKRECKGGGARKASASVTYSVSFTHAVRSVLALITCYFVSAVVKRKRSKTLISLWLWKRHFLNPKSSVMHL